ncbi:MAG TPA: hypothetical protein ENI86_14605 [Acidimicrobiales bacterium]|nr:hypothetical protein [Acidimicrobiales bacterium]
MNTSGVAARSAALEVLVAVAGGARTPEALNTVLESRGGLDARDRALITEMAHGAVRMSRALDFLIDPFLNRDIDTDVRALLRLGTYQIHWMGTPPHAAVSATVGAARTRVRGLVNAVLRRVSEIDLAGVEWPGEAVRLSYPDWLFERVTADLGSEAVAALEAMNRAQRAPARSDGFVQGLASVWVADEVPVEPGDTVLDLCAAPGGKATSLAGRGAEVVAADISRPRVRSLSRVAERFGRDRVTVTLADAARPPVRSGSVGAVLVDAPCSGLGALARRSDARWRLRPDDLDRLAELQGRILPAAADLVRPGGVLVYAVCTLTRAESVDVAGIVDARSDFEPIEASHPDRWRPWGSGGLVLPQDHGTDGMAVFRWRRRG